MSDYLIDGRAADETAFVAQALDPRRSCVVEACAGSGKTWLLVGRMVRLLLDGVAPGRILAITFTRRAAQEMRERLFADLAALARAGADERVAMLVTRGMPAAAARAAQAAAQGLYERVVTDQAGVTIDTFHGWFWRLVQSAPLSVGIGYAPTLLERTGPMLDEAWVDYCRQLLQPREAAALEDFERLNAMLGDDAARALLYNVVRRRAEWWCFAENGEAPIERACAPMRERLAQLAGSADEDPAALLRAPDLTRSLRRVLHALQSARPALATIDRHAGELAQWLDRHAVGSGSGDAAGHSAGHGAGHGAGIVAGTGAQDRLPRPDLAALRAIFLTQQGEPRQALQAAKLAPKLAHVPELQAQYGADISQIESALARVDAAALEWEAIELTRTGLRCAERLLECFAQHKRRAGAVDFTDLEWHAHRLLRDPDVAAYMQAFLDARYGQLLLDEFQDTNPLQWQVLQSWLASYEADAKRPCVFLVGDPKQSIYRFRGAEPRVFDVARARLERDYHAAVLRTNVTRRNAPALVDVFNRVFEGAHALYQPQSTRVASGELMARFVPLPLVARAPVQAAAATAPAASASAPAGGIDAWRDSLAQARPEHLRDERYREGLQIAECLRELVPSLSVPQGNVMRPARWSDVAILVRRRTHLAQVESALRDAGVPFLGGRRGSLLQQLEIEDLLAVLAFLSEPLDDLQLARALRCPLFDCDESDLLRLAAPPGAAGNWWARLLVLDAPSAPLARARALLSAWLPLAGVLPVHDLLDRIVFESDARARYATAAPLASCAQVQANIDALLELALALDAGRFPGLLRFLDEVGELRERDDSDAHEGSAADENAVRVMTIHAAKGLEAPVVVLPDAHFAERIDDRNDVLLGWPPEAPAPEHFSLVGRVSRIGAARAPWLDGDRVQRLQEGWNLLYVAMTRARQVLIVSGVAGANPVPNSWYAHIQSRMPPRSEPQAVNAAAPSVDPAVPAPARALAPAPVQPPRDTGAAARRFRDFRPPPLGLGARTDGVSTESMRLGSAWHAVLQRLSGPSTGAVAPAAADLARAFGLTPDQANAAIAAAQRVLAAPALQRFYSPAARADNELELVDADGGSLRIDRLVEFDDALWVLDYKWTLGPEIDAVAAHGLQMRRYARALRDAGMRKPIRLLLVGADAGTVELEAERGG